MSLNSTKPPHETVAVILSGGKSSRFGSDKALARLGKTKTPLIKLLKNRIDEAGFPLFISVDSPGKYSTFDIPDIADLFPCCGPLGGIATTLKKVEANSYLFLTCDMPFIEKEDLIRIWQYSNQNDCNTIYSCKEGFHPFPCVLLQNTLPTIERLISTGNFSMKNFFNICPDLKKLYREEDQTFLNMNTKQDYKTICCRIT